MLAGMLGLLLAGCSPPASELQLQFEQRIDHPEIDQPLSHEVRQEAGQTLLVQAQGHEVEYKVAVLEAGRPLRRLTTWWVRLPPLYTVVPAPPADRLLTVEITPLQKTADAHLALSIFEFPDDADPDLVEAYTLYGRAIEPTDSEAAEVWTPRVEGLKEASRLFGQNGHDEQSLWAASLAALFLYYPMYDNPSAITLAEETYRDAHQHGHERIALFNLSTAGQTLIERDTEDAFEETVRKQRLAQERFAQAMELAGSLGLAFEHAWAKNNRGIGYYYLDEFDEAVRWYEQALIDAGELGDPYFLNLVRGNLVLAREQQGDYDGQLEVLTAINRDLRAQENTNNLIHNLNDIGRLHRLLYQFPESIEVLAEAQALARETDDRESYARAGLWLAMAYRAMGYMERAEEILLDAIPRMEAVNNGRLLREAHQAAANMAQRSGRYETMRFHREEQRRYASSDANLATWFYNRGMDAIEAGDEDAFRWLDEALERFEAAEFSQMAHLTRLQRCAWALSSGAVQCDLDSTRQTFVWLLDHASTSRQFTAREVWIEILLGSGNSVEALSELETLIDDLAFYRQNLPGVLGAWFWDRRNEIFERYLGLLIERDLSAGGGLESLSALSRLRSMGLTSDSPSISAEQGAEIRRLLARREQSDGEQEDAIELEIDRLLLATRESAAGESEAPRSFNTSNIPEGHSVLAFHISDSGAWRWFVSDGKVRLMQLGDPQEIKRAVGNVRSNIRVAGYSNLDADLGRLGAMLLQNLEEQLPETINILAGGALNGLPFDALRLSGKYLVENHVVINRMTLLNIGESELPFTIERVFLAGNPEIEGVAMLAAAGQELDAVADTFSDAEIHRFEGAGLNVDAFETEAFRQSDLVHIASHASLDLKYPELSRLALSSDGTVERFLTPRELAASNPKARLIVLSACETVGSTEFSWDAGLGFVSELEGHGQKTMVASLWPIGDQIASRLFTVFYGKTAEGMEPSEALAISKRTLLQDHPITAWSPLSLVE